MAWRDGLDNPPIKFSEEDGWTPLHNAAGNAQVDVDRQLLERGVDVNAVGRSGSTALHLATRCDRTGRCVDILIAAGADVNLQNDRGWTALHLAAPFGEEQAGRALLAAGAKKDIPDKRGRTPYGVAITTSLLEILRP